MDCAAIFGHMAAFAPIIIIFLIIYYVLLLWAILQMLRFNANSVLLVFSFLALIPFPPLLLLGIFILIVWFIHKQTLVEST